MPTYVYECNACNQVFEADQSIKDDPLDTCLCGAVGTIKRVIQPVGIAFKGSGFHINDYSASTRAPSKSSDESTTKTADSKGDSNSGEAAKGDSGSSDSAPGDSKVPASSAPESTPAASKPPEGA